MNSSPKRNVLQPSANFSSNKPLNSSGGSAKKSLPVRDSGGRKSSFGPHPPASVARRNARERNRVKQVNSGFNVLRQHIPILCGDTVIYGGVATSPGQSANSKKNKMSKVETLRYAVEYIRNLEKLLAEADGTNARATPEPGSGSFSPASSSLLDDENLSPEAGTTGSGNEPSLSYSPSFYESSGSTPQQESPRPSTGSPKFLFPDFKPDLLPPFGCFKRENDDDDDFGDIDSIIQNDPDVANDQENAILDPLNNWWLPNV